MENIPISKVDYNENHQAWPDDSCSRAFHIRGGGKYAEASADPEKSNDLAVAMQIEAPTEKAACPKPVDIAKLKLVASGDAECTGAIAITDDGGNLLILATLDRTEIPMAMKEAQTAALWRRSTDYFQSESLLFHGKNPPSPGLDFAEHRPSRWIKKPRSHQGK